MDNEKKKDQSENDESQPYSFSDEATKNKIKKHLNDIRDVITESDIANAKVPGAEDDIPAPTEEVKRKGKKKDKKKGEDTAEGKPLTPWDIID